MNLYREYKSVFVKRTLQLLSGKTLMAMFPTAVYATVISEMTLQLQNVNAANFRNHLRICII